MGRLGLILTLALTTAAVASTPADAVASAWMDLQRVPPQDRPYVRYQSLFAVPGKDREKFLKVYSFHVNSLSRKAKLRPFHLKQSLGRADLLNLSAVISADMIRLDIRHFKWDAAVYEKLARVEPYFHEPGIKFEERELSKEVEWPGGVWPQDGKEYAKGAFKYRVKEKVRVPATGKNLAGAFWLPARQLAYLIAETKSEVPVIRADWFITQTAVSEEREAGYYDFLGLKNRADFFRLIGFDEKISKARESEIASIFRRSGVAAKNRQVYRFEAAGAGTYQTRDVLDRQTKEKNAVDSLNGDFKHDAEEHYGFLPNRLFAYFLSDKNGTLQKTAPDRIGPDKTSTSNDGRIHNPLSCIRCHVEGLRPLNDYGRQLWQGGNLLVAYDKAKFERFEQLYLRPLQRDVEDDAAKFARALAELNGPIWTPRENAGAYRDLWETYHDSDVTAEIAAREIGGLTARQLVERLRHYATPVNEGGLGQLIPQSLQGFTRDPPLPMLRDHFEENFAVLNRAARGYVPIQPPDPNRPPPRLPRKDGGKNE